MGDADSKDLGKSLSGANGALCNSRRAIHGVCSILEKTMKMQARCLIP